MVWVWPLVLPLHTAIELGNRWYMRQGTDHTVLSVSTPSLHSENRHSRMSVVMQLSTQCTCNGYTMGFLGCMGFVP